MRPWLLIISAAATLSACADQTAPSVPADEPKARADAAPSVDLSLAHANLSARTALSGGAATVFDASPDAFSFPAPNLAGARLAQHDEGDVAFEVVFSATAGSPNPGLGPVFDNVSCEACHEGDGRGRPPIGSEPFESLLLRASVPGRGPHGGPRPVPGLGTQLELRSVGILPDANAVVNYVESNGVFSDGTPFKLQVPTYTVTGVSRPLPPGTLISPRVAPAVFGLGLLEAVPDYDVLALAAVQAAFGRVSGRPNFVWDEIRGRFALGRFGWKANTPNLRQQAAGAYNGDIGITTSVFPAEPCEGADPACARHAPEVDDQTLANVAFYTQTLGVPARRQLSDPTALRGEVVFHQSGCASCHVPTLRTGTFTGVAEVSNQIIHPYTDLLVHDMGSGLADNRPDFQASGREWRTAPLWGIGLVETVNQHTRFLHDGRAGSLMEAILWHGGEAAFAQANVRQLSAADRAALIAFLQSL